MTIFTKNDSKSLEKAPGIKSFPEVREITGNPVKF